MRRALPTLLAVLVLGYLAGSWYFSNIIVATERRAPAEDLAELEEHWGADRYDWHPETVEVAVTGGSLVADYHAHPEPAGCAVILLHGAGGTRWDGMRFFPLFWERGCDVLAPDQRGHGEASAEWITYGAREQLDTLALVDWLVEERGHTREQIGLYGVSMGGAVALLTGALEPELAFVGADASYSSLRDIVTHRGEVEYGRAIHLMIPGALRVSELRGSFDVDDASPVAAAPRLMLPVFLIHGTDDEYTPSTHTEAIAAALKTEHVAVHLPTWGATHGQVVFANEEAYLGLMREFLHKEVPGFGRDPLAEQELREALSYPGYMAE